MIYSIKPIPTLYAGVRFRSRLEARWAAFFDLAGWSWEYEPFDLDGWTPDFSIRQDDGRLLLIEVKPIDFAAIKDDEPSDRMEALAREHASKAFETEDPFDDLLGYDDLEQNYWGLRRKSGEFEVIVVGISPLITRWQAILGVFTAGDFSAAVLDTGKGRLDVRSEFGCFLLRISGLWDGDHYLNDLRPDRCSKMWKEASNKVQWRPRRRPEKVKNLTTKPRR